MGKTFSRKHSFMVTVLNVVCLSDLSSSLPFFLFKKIFAVILLQLSAFSPHPSTPPHWVYGVNFYGRRPVRFSGTVSLISSARRSWAVIYVGSWYVFGFWLLLGVSLVGLSLQKVNWESLHLPRLLFCCAGVDGLCWSWLFCVYMVLRTLSRSCSIVCSG